MINHLGKFITSTASSSFSPSPPYARLHQSYLPGVLRMQCRTTTTNVKNTQHRQNMIVVFAPSIYPSIFIRVMQNRRNAIAGIAAATVATVRGERWSTSCLLMCEGADGIIGNANIDERLNTYQGDGGRQAGIFVKQRQTVVESKLHSHDPVIYYQNLKIICLIRCHRFPLYPRARSPARLLTRWLVAFAIAYARVSLFFGVSLCLF